MVFIETLELAGLGNHSHLAGGDRAAVVIDPPRDIDQVIATAARRGVRIALVAETHLHNDYVSGGLELARVCGARYLVPDGAPVSFAHTAVADGDTITVDRGLALRALATPGHTPHHTSYVLEDGGAPVAAFTGGSLLIGSVGRPDLVEPRLTERLARDQHASAHRLADALPDDVRVEVMNLVPVGPRNDRVGFRDTGPLDRTTVRGGGEIRVLGSPTTRPTRSSNTSPRTKTGTSTGGSSS